MTLGLVAEHGAGYDNDDGAPGDPSEVVAGTGPVEGGLGRLAVAASEVVDIDLDPMTDAEVRAALAGVQRVIDRLLGWRSKAAGTLESRALRAAGPGREAQALRGTRQRLSDELRLTPSQVKTAGETGRRIAESAPAQQAMTAGTLPPDHARVLADTLAHLDGATRDQAQQQLLAAAEHQDATTFGRTCRRLLAALDATAAQRAQDRRNARRRLRVTQTPDGMLALHGQGSGWDAEVVQTGLHAFCRPDAPGQHRSAEQRSWDALVALCQTALDHGDAPTNRNVRPHVLVTVPASLLSPQDSDDGGDGAGPAATPDREGAAPGTSGGVVEAGWSGPLPWPEVRRHLTDATISRLLIDAGGLPLEASQGVRTVPAGLWKALQIRDRTCIGHNCDIPAAWCQVMHLDTPYRYDGRLTLETAAPGCNYHHRMLDRHHWSITWIDGRPILHHPHHPPPDRTDPPGEEPERPPHTLPRTGTDPPDEQPQHPPDSR